MVSTRRSQKTKDDGDEAGEAEAEQTIEPQSPARRSTRRTRSNSTAVQEEEETMVVTEKKWQSPPRRKSPRKRRGSSVGEDDDHDQDDDVAETETTSDVQVEAIVDADSQKSQVQTQKDDEKGQSTEVEAASGPRAKADKASLSVLNSERRLNKNERDNNSAGNELTNLIPGYVAPLKLDTSSLDSYRPTGGLDDLCKRAQQTDASTAGFVVNAAEPHAQAMKKTTSNGCMSYASLYSNFKHGTKRAPDHSAGAGWFGMTPTPMTDELKTDLAVIRNRNYLDPKRFYKSADSKNKVMQLGTVIEGSAEFYSSRLAKKQRRTNLTEEIMADPAAADYTRNKYKRMQQEKSEKGRRYNKKKLSKRARRGY